MGYIDIETFEVTRNHALKISRMLGEQIRLLEGYITARCFRRKIAAIARQAPNRYKFRDCPQLL